MSAVYVTVLMACTAALLALIVRRALWVARRSRSGAGPRPARGRLINEWIWTAIPVLVLLVLLWQALKMAQ